MNWSDTKGQKLCGVSNPKEILETLNTCVQSKGIANNQYYFRIDKADKTVISNVPAIVYEGLQLKKYVGPKNVNQYIESFILNLQENINILHNNHPDGKVFQLNQCYYNSSRIFQFMSYLVVTEKVVFKQQTKPIWRSDQNGFGFFDPKRAT